MFLPAQPTLIDKPQTGLSIGFHQVWVSQTRTFTRLWCHNTQRMMGRKKSCHPVTILFFITRTVKPIDVGAYNLQGLQGCKWLLPWKTCPKSLIKEECKTGQGFKKQILICIFNSMSPHSSTLVWKIPRTEEPRRLQFMGSLRVGHDWATSLSLFTFMHWRRKWQPTPVFLPGESQGWGSLVGCRLWGRTESDTTEVT